MSSNKNLKNRNFESGLLFQTLRKKAKLRQQDIAVMVGVGSSTVEFWESGTTYPKVESLKKLLEIYLRYQLFSPGTELVEAEKIWEMVRQDAPRFNATFDHKWFEAVVKSINPPTNNTKPNHSLNNESTFTSKLPERLTSFVGRKQELAILTTWLRYGKDRLPVRLLTMTGTGGCGKTSLGLEVVREVAGHFNHNIRLVELASISTPSGVTQSLAVSLDLKEQSGKPLLTTITDYLREKQLLLVLDNCEQVVTECAQVANSLLRTCPGLVVLATSRESLQVSGEQVFRVPSLSLPPLSSHPNQFQFSTSNLRLPGQLVPFQIAELMEYEAIQLFVERAKGVSVSFSLDEQNMGMVTQICHRLDGIPLAIELAAARLKILDIFQLSERLADRFRLLRSGADRTVLPRHQTLRATLEWSYDLLSEPERQLFRQLSVFVGGWQFEATEKVCFLTTSEQAEIMDLLDELVNKSLVIVEEVPLTIGFQGAPLQLRFRLLETLREFGQEQLEKGEAGGQDGEQVLGLGSEKQELQARHLLYYASFAARCVPIRREPQSYDQGRGIALLTGEFANLRAALDWSCSPANQKFSDLLLLETMDMACAVSRLWSRFNYFEDACDYLITLREKARLAGLDKSPQYGWISDWFGRFLLNRGEYKQSQFIHQANLELFTALQDKQGIMISLDGLGLGVNRQGENRQALKLHKQSLALANELDDKSWKTRNLRQLGFILTNLGEYQEAESYLQLALKEVREIGDPVEIGSCLVSISPCLAMQEKFEEANNCLQESLQVWEEIGNKNGLGTSLGNLGMLASIQGDLEKAIFYHQQAYKIQKEVGARGYMALCLSNLSDTSIAIGKYEDAAHYNKEALALYQEMGDRLGMVFCLGNNSKLERFKGNYEAAVTNLQKSLAILKDLEVKYSIIEYLLDLAEILLITFNELPKPQKDPEGSETKSKKSQYLEGSVRLTGIAAGMQRETGGKFTNLQKQIFDQVSAGTRSKLADDRYSQIFAEGQAMTFNDALNFAINDF